MFQTVESHLYESFGDRGQAGTLHSFGVRGANPLGYYKHNTPTEFGRSRRGLNKHCFGCSRAGLSGLCVSASLRLDILEIHLTARRRDAEITQRSKACSRPRNFAHQR